MTGNLAGLAADPLFGGIIGRTTTPTGPILGGSATTGSNVNAGQVIGAATKKATTTTAPCPVNCREENTPVTYYLSTQPSPGSVPVRGSQRRVICDTPPKGTPTIPCEDLNTALQSMGNATADPTRNAMQAYDSSGNPVMQYQDPYALNDSFSGVFYSEFL